MSAEANAVTGTGLLGTHCLTCLLLTTAEPHAYAVRVKPLGAAVILFTVTVIPFLHSSSHRVKSL